MARLIRAKAWRKLERPYTRFSKFKKLSYVRSRPVCRVVRFDMGEPQKKFAHKLHLVAKADLQIRDNALESARQTCLRFLEKSLGKAGYHFQVRAYPHHVLRNNPLAAGAGADRLSTGMAHSFGKSVGIAARIRNSRPVFTVKINKEHLPLARQALKRAGHKMPCSCQIIIE